jgi:hypothetical protein
MISTLAVLDSVITFQLRVARLPVFFPLSLARPRLVMQLPYYVNPIKYTPKPVPTTALHGHSLRVPGAHIIVTQNPLWSLVSQWHLAIGRHHVERHEAD